MKILNHTDKIIFILFFFIGLENIDLPPLDSHDWRQTLTISMAKEYVNHPNIFFPRTIIGEQQEFIAAEFPFFSYILSIIYKVFGFDDWYGRLLNWCITFWGLICFYKIVTKSFNKQTALLSSIAMMSSIVFEFARKSMPDTFSLAFNFIGIYYIFKYLIASKKHLLLLGSIFCLIGSLNKISFINLWPFLILPIFNPKFSYDQKAKISVLFLAIIAIIYFWYFRWVPYLLDNGASQLFWPYSLTDGWNEFYKLRYEAFNNIQDSTFHNSLIFYISIFGLLFILFREKLAIKLFVISYILIFLLFSIKSGIVFPTHNYYVIPIVPLLCIGFGYLISMLKINKYLSIVFTLVLCYQGLLFNKKVSFNPHHNRYYLELPSIVDNYIPENSKILVNGGSFNPTMMFWSGRKGWTYSKENFLQTSWIGSLKKRGVEYVVQDKNKLKKMLNYPILFEDENWIIYKP